MTKNEIIEGVKNKYIKIKYLYLLYKNDKEIVLAAVQQDGRALKYASEELQNNKNIVLIAVQQDGHSLKYVSKNLQNNKEVVLAAIQKNIDVSTFISTKLENKIGNNDPIQYLKSILLQKKLNKKLINNNTAGMKKNKI